MVVGLTPDAPPTVDAGGPYSVNEGSSVTLDRHRLGPEGDALTYEWDLNNDGTFETPGHSVILRRCGWSERLHSTSKRRNGRPDGGRLGDSELSTISRRRCAALIVSPEPSTEGSSVTASASFSDPGVNDAPFTCTVNYGDGSGDLAGAVSGYICTGPAHTYPTFGSYTVTISVTDKDGGTGSNTTTHTVNFKWSGFFQPVDNPPMLNVVKAGSAVPVKFSLGGEKGLNIFAVGYPQSTKIDCVTGDTLGDPASTANPGGSSLTYGNSGQYNYVWKTRKRGRAPAAGWLCS